MTDEQEDIEIEEPLVEGEEEPPEQEELEDVFGPEGEVPLPVLAGMLAAQISDEMDAAQIEAEVEEVLVAVLVRVEEGRQRYTWRSVSGGWAMPLALSRRICAELERSS